MPITRTRLVASQDHRDFTIPCTTVRGNSVSVRVPRAVIDKLEPPGNYSYVTRLERHMHTIMNVAKVAYKAGKLRDRMIQLRVDDFQHDHQL